MLASGLDPFKPSNLAFTTDPDDKEGLALASKALGGEDLYELADGFDAPGSGTFPLQVGLWLLQHRKRDAAQATQRHLYCLSTHDELQHLYGPGSPEANAFYQRFDTLLGDFDKEGAVVGVTADHGMNDKFRYDGSPRVVWADKILKDAGVDANVLLPFGDENPDHLGSCAIIHLKVCSLLVF
jgi:predicted AlkP superfamily pyrophosphatase or phosphodiesterase